MKKYLVVTLILLCSIAYGGENYKGKISLIFNGEKIELPINFVTLKKENKILISIRAEQSNKEDQQLFKLEWEMDKLSTNDKDLTMTDAFLLSVVNNEEGKIDELRFRMDNNGEDGELFVQREERTWNLTSMAMKFNIENVLFEDSSIFIEGNLSFKARDGKSENPLKSVSEIEDCKFEIVI
ncbi:MAG: hypothetical protein OQJ81_00515 [Melioribacteraceae bacterium]|nr:hypothetical protein [Melioribacteraceae bacterium]